MSLAFTESKEYDHQLISYLQQTTCSIFTGRYLERISEVLRIKHLNKTNTVFNWNDLNGERVESLLQTVFSHAHLFTMLMSSWSFSSPAALSLSLASASRPFRIGISNRFLNSWAVPERRDGWMFTQSTFIVCTSVKFFTGSCTTGMIKSLLPRIPEFTKCTKLKYSSKSFWMGVPDISTLLWAFIEFSAWYVWLSEFFSLWP